jgi:uncharacterized protein YlxW (UPF0749 family)
MEWLSYLLILLCPLMMIFCMKGHMGGHSHQDDKHASMNIDKKVDHLQEENKKLRNEIEALSKMVKKES